MSARVRTWQGALDRDRVTEVLGLVDLARRHDGVEPLGEQTVLDLGAEDAGHVLATDGPLVGYGQLGPSRGGTRTAELVVAPDSRDVGLGGRVLAALLELADAPDASPGATQVRLWAHGSLPAASVLARRANLVPVRELWRMARDLTSWEASDAELPAGVALRAFEPGRDEAAWLDVNAAAFAHHPEQGAMTTADLAAREAEPWFRAGDLLLAERDGELLGFAWTKVTGTVGELYVLGVAPAAQGQGLGRALTTAALEHLRRRGTTRAILFTDADNTAAVRTYTAAGFAVDRADTQFAPSGA